MDWKLGDPVVNLYCFFLSWDYSPALCQPFPKSLVHCIYSYKIISNIWKA